ncbi:AAA-domain-containing protein [Gloeophyllum trabeum ATCC 11539]|uniref:AAA-domain-containing protein n=1 Tax=Gloeophyllum trabeum (strain ATCC 11539 / FP-39264 / Madison 617) TaxID=670483 RepID=S7RU40_GLOTA|nr:AAA-domain-containing protein [Gloeophyllum trabeum ATCC 11539]EPQ58230.1 AAA-domain-containing protein [Gloeophyllum trabeum ATCC 11539]
MTSQLLLRRTRSLLKTSSRLARSSRKSARIRIPGKDALPRTTRVYKRSSSSSTTPPTTTTDSDVQAVKADSQSASPDVPPEAPAEEPEPEKVRRTRTRTTTTASKEPESAPALPSGLDIIWAPESEPESSNPNAIPPPAILDEALNNLHVTLHPQTQHRSVYPSAQGPPIEPTLALYCPIEGGDYIIDETVRELARRTGSEVLVLDSVQIAAGECGQFGKAANAISLPRNPLHVTSSTPLSQPPRRIEDEEDDDDMPGFSIPSQMTLHVLAPMRTSRTIFASGSGTKGSPTAKAKAFFDELINIPSPANASGATPLRRPRIIFVRDFGTLASTSSSWYPSLLQAVRQRRQGPISRPTSPVVNPMTIVFGITPPIVPPTSSLSSSGHGGYSVMNMLTGGRSSASVAPAKSGKTESHEDEIADKLREKRLRRRLKKWEKGDAALQDELPKLSLQSTDEGEDRGSSSGRPEVVFLNGAGGTSIQSGLNPFFGGGGPSSNKSSGSSDADANSRFFRTSVVVPSVRSLSHERECRISRRRQINELIMRMGVSTVGGILPELEEVPQVSEDKVEPTEEKKEGPATELSDAAKLWHEWGNRIEIWRDILHVADRAVGAVISENMRAGTLPTTLDPTPIPWETVFQAWASHRSGHEVRKLWAKESLQKVAREEEEEVEDEDNDMEADEVVERIKRDNDLDHHERRLLGCIVDSASMPTSFEQVHLPPNTIDAVRTIVSLPILHPMAFQHGILKDHSMTGCLLFGPPGTGKTLVVRALAKEAGCRMLAISPSDVMDMYVGEGEKLVKAVFSLARRLAPCVVFLDELDALFGARSSARETGGAIAHRSVITEFMQEMDGLRSSKDDNVIVIGATNRPFDLDDAVLRRLPRRLLIDLPGEREREEILKIHLRGETLGNEVDLKALAKKTENFSGSDLKHLCVAAALDAVKEKVEVPWKVASSSAPSPAESSESTSSLSSAPEQTQDKPADQGTSQAAADADKSSLPDPSEYSRVLHWHNFTKALTEIVPSSSETLGSLADLRKWNEEFGEGRKGKRKTVVWGKGKFGFTDQGSKIGEEVRISAAQSAGPVDVPVER